MQPKIIFQKIVCNSKDIEEQGIAVRSLIFKLTGKRIKHSRTGRPIIDQSVDVSISHKNDLAYVGIVSRPYKIGIDVEHIKNDINTELFLKFVITKKEVVSLKMLCKNSNISLSAGVAIFWSIKEAFFKCLDYDLKPRKINIANICKNSQVKINCSKEIKGLMREKKLKFCFAKAIFNEQYVYSQVVMRLEYS
jgi:phosphopantetheinyl transferase